MWKEVKGYENSYQVNECGDVRSIRNDKHIISPKTTNSGYLQVHLYKNGKCKAFLVHRLVASAFLINPYDYETVNHIDENKLNNHVDNLEWCSLKMNNEKYNNNHPIKTRKIKIDVNVEQRDLDGCLIKTWKNPREVKIKTGFNDWSIKQCCKGVRKTAYGYHWNYI